MSHSRAYYIVRGIARAATQLVIAGLLAWGFWFIWTFAALMQDR